MAWRSCCRGSGNGQVPLLRIRLVVSHEYLPDGSERVEIRDEITDVIGRYFKTITRSAECLAIDAQIGMNTDTRCHVAEQR